MDREHGGAEAIYEEFTDRRTLAKIVTGFLVAGALVYLLGFAAGWRQVGRALAGAEFRWLVLACASTLVGLVAWSRVWGLVLGCIGIEVSAERLVVTYFSATFANYVTPFGQAGGEPFIAYVLSQETGASYEDSLASIVIADLLNLLPFFNFAALGLAVVVLRSELPTAIRPLAFGLTALAVGIPIIAYAGWNYRTVVEDVVLRLLSPVVGRTKRFSIESVRARIESFYGSLEVITDEPRALLGSVAWAYVGWVFFALPLYFAGLTLGQPIDAFLVLFIVPASTIAGLVPTPGGLGSVETALVVLLIALVGVSASQGFALAAVYRLSSYWFALTVGGLATMYVIARA